MKDIIHFTDGYKLDHRRQYPEKTQKVYANWTARSANRYPAAKDGHVVFGFSYLIQKYLIEDMNKNFFDRPWEQVQKRWNRRINTFLGPNGVGDEHIKALHDLGYLPLEIKALPEGTVCPIGVPCMTVVNTGDFHWVTNYFETLISNILWMPMTSATTARLYKKQLFEHCGRVGLEIHEGLGFNCHDFSMRGMPGIEASVISGLGHMTSFFGTETIPAIDAAELYYGTDAEKELLAATVPATEHSVMCAGGKEDELETFKRLLTEVYPDGFVSIVSDTWDLWKVVTNFIPRLHKEIMARNGRFVLRPDSGDPIDIICGNKVAYYDNLEQALNTEKLNSSGWDSDYSKLIRIVNTDTFYKIYRQTETMSHDGVKYTLSFNRHVPSPADYGVYELLYKEFGGTETAKGFKIPDSHVGIIYGDAITIARQKEIYERLEAKGYCASSIVLGVGSFTYQYVTRDTLGFALKSTWVQIDGKGVEIWKDPVTDDGTKKSKTGLLQVYWEQDGLHPKISVKDQCTLEEEKVGLLQTIFKDGRQYLAEENTLAKIRERINESLK